MVDAYVQRVKANEAEKERGKKRFFRRFTLRNFNFLTAHFSFLGAPKVSEKKKKTQQNSRVTCETLKSVHPEIWTLIKPFKEESSLSFPLPSLSDVSLRVYQMVYQVQEISQFLLGEKKESWERPASMQHGFYYAGGDQIDQFVYACMQTHEGI